MKLLLSRISPLLVCYATLCWLFLWSKGREERKDALPRLLLAPKHRRDLPPLPGFNWQARKIAPRAPLAAFSPVELYAGRTYCAPGWSSWDLQGAQGKSGVCHPRRIRRRVSESGQSQNKASRSHYPTLPLAQVRRFWSKKQMSSLITQAFFACASSRVCSVSVPLQLSLRLCFGGEAQLLGRREGRASPRLSPAKRYGSDGSLLKIGREKAASAWHFWLRGQWGEQTQGSKGFLFLPESNSWWGSDFISLVIIGLAGYPLEPHCIEWRASETSILLNGNYLAAILRCPLRDSKTNKQTHASSGLLKKPAQVWTRQLCHLVQGRRGNGISSSAKV